MLSSNKNSNKIDSGDDDVSLNLKDRSVVAKKCLSGAKKLRQIRNFFAHTAKLSCKVKEH